jgi:transcriptional regulator with XRE-family HTH domain/tetratricopeptide (TPR) repeat protein
VSDFGDLLRRHRTAAGLSREDLAERSGVSARGIADLELGQTKRPRMDTISLLADALQLTHADHAKFKAAARGAVATADGGWAAPPGPPSGDDPHAWLAFIVATLDWGGVVAARSAVAQWEDRARPDPAWLAWAERLVTLTEDGTLPSAGPRPLPTDDPTPFVGRHKEAADLGGFLDRVQRGRGGLALILGPSGIGKSRLIARALAGGLTGSQAEWITLDRDEAGYLGWSRLLTPLWTTVRRNELAPASLLPHALILDDILLVGSDSDLAGRRFKGEVAAAVAALLAHEALRKPLVLVIDDAHLGGITLDHLLLGVARRVNASRVGLIAALRPDELDDDSPLRGYRDQGGGRAASDVVTPIQLPSLDFDSIASLIEKRTRVAPPAKIVEQVAQQTGGRPQLINNIELQAPADTTEGAWNVRLGAHGLQVLLDTIDSRPEAVRDILRAAAVCADGGYADPDLVAGVTGQAGDVVVQVLDEERRTGQILIARSSRYRFQHDNWIDVLISSCSPVRLRALHAECFALLGADRAADPKRLIRHAIEAGTADVGREELAALASQAADQEVANYAFSSAAQMYEVAAGYAVGAEQPDLLIEQSDALRLCGRWQAAREVLRHAVLVARRLGTPEREAIALVHLEHLTFSYGLDEREVTAQQRDVMTRLPPGEAALRAQVQAVLAQRLSISPRQYENEQVDLARSALQQLPSVTDPLARADIVLGIRGGLQDSAPPEELLQYDHQVLDLGLKAHSAFHIAEALSVCIVDTIRTGRLAELPSAIRANRDFAERSGAAPVVYLRALVEAMLALARGEWEAARGYTDEAGSLGRDWGSMAQEALMAQAGWRLYETGQLAGLADFLTGLQQQEVSSLNGEVWQLAAGLIHAENGEAEPAIEALREVCRNTGDLRGLARGPARIGILSAAAMVLGHPILHEAMPQPEAHHLGTGIAELLADHPDKLVLAGWPAVLLGSKQRYIGLAYLAAGQPERAAEHLAHAVKENAAFRVLHTRTRFDLARALMLQPDSYAEGLAEMRRVQQEAADLKMHCLAAQTTVEQNRTNPEP